MIYGTPITHPKAFEVLIEAQTKGILTDAFESGLRAALEYDPQKRWEITTAFINTLDPHTMSSYGLIEVFKQFVAGQTAAHKLVGEAR